MGPGRQHGTALITALLVLALTVVVATDMTTQQQFDVRRTGNMLTLEQAHQIALGGERWAVAVLARDRRDEPAPGRAGGGTGTADVDSLDEDWAQQLPPLPVEGGQIGGRIIDLQGRFNINSLIVGEAVDALALARFERLLQALEIEPSLAQAVVDWLDGDAETTFPDGAEDDFYAGSTPPYLAANRPLAVISGLRLVRGFEPAIWRRLAPHITALPDSTAINVNTASAPVLQALVPGLDAGAAEQLVARAEEEPFASVPEFLEQGIVQEADVAAAGLAVRSDHFRVQIAVALGPLEYTLYSWLQRNDNGASRVLRRARVAY